MPTPDSSQYTRELRMKKAQEGDCAADRNKFRIMPMYYSPSAGLKNVHFKCIDSPSSVEPYYPVIPGYIQSLFFKDTTSNIYDFSFDEFANNFYFLSNNGSTNYLKSLSGPFTDTPFICTSLNSPSRMNSIAVRNSPFYCVGTENTSPVMFTSTRNIAGKNPFTTYYGSDTPTLSAITFSRNSFRYFFVNETTNSILHINANGGAVVPETVYTSSTVTITGNALWTDSSNVYFIALISGSYVLCKVDKVAPYGNFTQLLGGLSNPQGIALHSNGNIYISETGKNRILLFNPSTNITSVIASGLNNPRTIFIHRFDNVFFLNGGTYEVMRLLAPPFAP